ncbi:MAG: DUF402 domain-containing protein [Erysipelotrichaceae bacterium]|jgi:protein associated with RNAse G/E|nr:DUF402 domain-containing protein [Bacillota bacterium]NLP22859.1 DUF402 domain-containing protein [Erysipelotrichaceae bacterium]HCY06983.1 hypothetical protein [Erysipelotrichaceae bacterium]
MVPNVLDHVYIQSYKHDGSLHRTWSKGFVIETDKDKIVVVTNKTWVIESDGRKWYTREPAICFFYKERWFNVITMIRKAGIYYYCNIASPSLYDGEAIKNIDYDLDVKLYPNGEYEILDEDEYEVHSKKMNYSKELKEILEKELKSLLNDIQTVKEPFSDDYISYYYDLYQRLIKEN